jgi:hypothetical protein
MKKPKKNKTHSQIAFIFRIARLIPLFYCFLKKKRQRIPSMHCSLTDSLESTKKVTYHDAYPY